MTVRELDALLKKALAEGPRPAHWVSVTDLSDAHRAVVDLATPAFLKELLDMWATDVDCELPSG